jgi:hypothetical protein
MLQNIQQSTDPARDDISTFFDAMDLDDECSFGPKDLTARPPRSARCRLGGYVILPRILDKCRALLKGVNGESNFDCSLDRRFFQFAGVDAQALKDEVAAGKSDLQILSWIRSLPGAAKDPSEIERWSTFRENAVPSETEQRQYMIEAVEKFAAHRDDIASWSDLLDVDDFVSFGGVA